MKTTLQSNKVKTKTALVEKTHQFIFSLQQHQCVTKQPYSGLFTFLSCHAVFKEKRASTAAAMERKGGRVSERCRM